jgi:adenylylsulfate kinase
VRKARGGLAIRWHGGELTDAARARRLKQKGGVVWLTGLSGSGKSTVARALEKALVERGVHAAVLDGDNLRHGLNRDAELLRAAGHTPRAARRFGLGFSAEDRRENIRRAAEAAALFARNNVLALVALISPFRADRAAARALAPRRFLEIHCAAPLSVCEARDPKGLYKKARAGVLRQFTGLTSPYEPPRRPDLTLATGTEPLERSVDRLLRLLKRRRFF